MKRSFSICMGLFFGFLLTLAVATQAKAQDKSKAKEDRLTGSIHMINKDTSTVTIRRGNVQRQVVYNADTKITYRNKPGSMDDVKEAAGSFVWANSTTRPSWSQPGSTSAKANSIPFLKA